MPESKATTNALVRQGYNPRNMVYLPFDKDPLNMGDKSKTMGLTLPVGGYRWEDFKSDKHFGEAATAMSDFIDENYKDEDREYMQSNAQYINSRTLIPDDKPKVEVVEHESMHKAIGQQRKSSDLDLSHSDEELLIRLQELRTGSEATKKRATKFIESTSTIEEIEKRLGPKLDLIMALADKLNKAKETSQ